MSLKVQVKLSALSLSINVDNCDLNGPILCVNGPN